MRDDGVPERLEAPMAANTYALHVVLLTFSSWIRNQQDLIGCLGRGQHGSEGATEGAGSAGVWQSPPLGAEPRGIGNELIESRPSMARGCVHSQERLGSLLDFYRRVDWEQRRSVRGCGVGRTRWNVGRESEATARAGAVGAPRWGSFGFPTTRDRGRAMPSARIRNRSGGFCVSCRE